MKKSGCFLLFILNISISSFAQRTQDSLALVALYNSTNGANWTNKTNWLSSQPISTWFGVTVTNNRVLDLQLDNNNLNGNIPPEIGNLTNLQNLSLSENQLSGSIPHEIWNLTKLSAFNLEKNQLSGSLPSEIKNLINLTSLILSVNQLSGPVPSEIWSITKLQQININWNQLSGTFPPDVGNLINLFDLQLGSNQISGTIPGELGNLINLIALRLDGNKLTGSLPTGLWNLTKLTEFGVKDNQLTGNIPPEINNLNKLTQLYLSNNKFDALPSLTLKLLVMLWIQNNRLTFEDIEPNISLPLLYIPQDSIGLKQNITRNAGENFTFMVTCGGAHNQYQWYKDNDIIPTATSTSYTILNINPSDAGSYTCAVTNSIVSGLTIYSRPIKLQVSTATDVDDVNNRGMKVYPNPTTGLINIELNEFRPTACKVDVRDTYGRVVLIRNLGDKTLLNLNLTYLPRGMYFLRIQSDTKCYFKKIVIK